jgi:putative acetyltransferase
MSGSLEIVLRSAEAADLAAIARLHAFAFATLAAGQHSAEQIAAHTRLTEAPDYESDLLRSHLAVALSAAREIVASTGWIAVPEAPGTARIRKVFVHPSLARRGLATRLVLDAERRALAAGHARVMVRANRNAVPLYLKLGYRPLGEGVMTTPDGVNLPVVFMEKPAAATALRN